MVNKSIVDAVVTMLRMYDVDGETMEHIINEVGMRDQMIKQLTPQDDIVKLEQDPTFTQVVTSFTKQELIEYTCTIQERFKTAVIDSITNAGIDFNYYTEIELNDKELELTFNERGILSEIERAIDDAFEIDDDSVWDEATNVITFMK